MTKHYRCKNHGDRCQSYVYDACLNLNKGLTSPERESEIMYLIELVEN